MRSQRIVAAISLLVLSAFGVFAQIADRNVNMVSGTGWPDGDPFLQRQNEPSIAVSTRNPHHLLAGANDYRTVDVPGLPTGPMPGEAWVGIFRSSDGGSSWKSAPLPGYPQDTSAAGLASPLKGLAAGADPVVRAGTNGMFYMTGIAFNREENGDSAVFVARFMDLNHKEAGDPITYIDTKVLARGTSGRSIDKPWIAVGLPRPGGGECHIEGQSFAAGDVYVAWTELFNEQNSIHSRIMFSRSVDCGQNWATPIKLSESNSVNQGTTIAIDPVSGKIGIAWRRFASSSQSNAIVYVSSSDFGVTFTKATEIATGITPFEQGTTATSFRTTAYPSIVTDAASRTYVAWSERVGPEGDGRIVMSTTTDGSNWSPLVQVDPNSNRGHQLMPSLTFAYGRLYVLYYDLRDDSTIGVFTPIPGRPAQYTESRLPVGDLADPAQPAKVFTPFVTDSAPAGFDPIKRRHTIDVRLAAADPGALPVFASARVSRYKFGSRPGSTRIEQLQVNPPNLPMFRLGTVPFFGDYVDIAAQPYSFDGTRWRANVDRSSTGTLHAIWADNRDVRPPADGNWANYTPVQSPAVGTTSKFDPTQTVPPCVVGQTGSRNQNIYTARITDGLIVTVPGNAKPLNTAFRRGFVVNVRNATLQTRSFRMTIVDQPPGGKASFLEFPLDAGPVTALDVRVPPRSSSSRMVFITSTQPRASVRVDVDEISAPGAPAPLPGGLRGTATINPDFTNPDIANPDIANPDIANPDIANAEIRNPDIANPDIANPDIANPDIANPDIANPDIANPDIANPDIANPDIANPDIANPDIANPDIANPDIANPDIANGSLTDTTWRVKNEGNTTSSYTVKLLKNSEPPPGFKLQLMVSRVTMTPIARGCELGLERHVEVLTSITDPQFTTETQVTDPDIQNPSEKNLTLWIAPGSEALLTLRSYDPDKNDALTFNAATAVIPVVVSHGSNSDSVLQPATLTILTSLLADGVAGQPYSQHLSAVGGAGARSWSASNLPSGLSVGTADGTISGTPTAPGISEVVLTVTDATGDSATRAVSLRIASPLEVSTTTLPVPHPGSPYSAQLAATGGVAPYHWSVVGGALPDGLSLSAEGLLSGTPQRLQTAQFTVAVEDSASPSQTATFTFELVVSPFLRFEVQPEGEQFACLGPPNGLPLVCEPFELRPRPVVVAEDGAGNPLPGVAVVLTLAANGGSGRLLGATTATTGEDGRARFDALCIDEPGTGYAIAAAAGSETRVSNAFDVGPENVLGVTCVLGAE